MKVVYSVKGKEQSEVVYQHLKPYGTLWYKWGKCASYDISDHDKELEVKEVRITSPVKVDVILHSKDQSSIPLELSTLLRFDSSHEIQVTVEKTIDVYQAKKPCYKPEDHGGETYGEHDYKLLSKTIMEKFNCTTPFIPSEYRNGSEICSNKNTGRRVHQFLRSTSASLVPNMWRDSYHSIPPCVYHTYNIHETKTEGKSIANISTIIFIHCRDKGKKVLS